MTILGFTLTAAVIWLIAAAILAIIEALTTGLTTIWFAGGAVVAAIGAMIGTPILAQVALFLVVSLVLLYFTRPIALKKMKLGSEKTNVDALIGKEALIITKVEPFSTGQGKINGLIWSVVSNDPHMTIEAGTPVEIIRIEGVKLIVIPISK
ncbi:MAG: NfeD family protein [Anaerovoracaceae bacterium]